MKAKDEAVFFELCSLLFALCSAVYPCFCAFVLKVWRGIRVLCFPLDKRRVRGILLRKE
jgi:hypothetical protein